MALAQSAISAGLCFVCILRFCLMGQACAACAVVVRSPSRSGLTGVLRSFVGRQRWLFSHVDVA